MIERQIVIEPRSPFASSLRGSPIVFRIGLIMLVEVSRERVLLQRDSGQKQPVFSRLSKIEGQVRGLRQMVEADRHCGEILQQSAAIRAALREVTMLCVQSHLEAAIDHAGRADEDSRIATIADITNLLRSALKQ